MLDRTVSTAINVSQVEARSSWWKRMSPIREVVTHLVDLHVLVVDNLVHKVVGKRIITKVNLLQHDSYIKHHRRGLDREKYRELQRGQELTSHINCVGMMWYHLLHEIAASS